MLVDESTARTHDHTVDQTGIEWRITSRTLASNASSGRSSNQAPPPAPMIRGHAGKQLFVHQRARWHRGTEKRVFGPRQPPMPKVVCTQSSVPEVHTWAVHVPRDSPL